MVKTMAAPKNRQMRPAVARCEMEREAEIVLVVMSPSVRPVERNSNLSAGLLTSRLWQFLQPSQLPSGLVEGSSSLTVAGAVMALAPNWVNLTIFPLKPLGICFWGTD